MLLTVNIIDQNDAPLLADITLGVDSSTGVSTLASVITDETFTNIQVSKTGYYTYDKQVFVHTGAVTVTIRICQVVTSIVDPNYQKPFPLFFTIEDPCSHDVAIYNASATVYSEISYYINNVLKYVAADATHRFSAHGEYQIKQRMQYADTLAGIQYYDIYRGSVTHQRNLITETVEQALNFDVISNITLNQITPQFSIDLTNPDMLLDSTVYYSLRSEVTITPTFMILNPECTGEGVIRYNIYNAYGNLLYTYEVSTAADPEDLQYTFQMNYIGDYKIVASLIDCCNSYDVITYVAAADFILMYPVSDGCNDYRISNFSQTITVEVSVSSLLGESIVPLQLLEPGKSIEIPLTAMGTYKVYTKYSYLNPSSESIPVEKFYFITNYCGVEECLADFMVKLFCKEDCGCQDNTKLILTINKINALLFNYFSHLNNLYSYNRAFDVLSDSDLKMFSDADLILAKLGSYCNGTNCNCGC